MAEETYIVYVCSILNHLHNYMMIHTYPQQEMPVCLLNLSTAAGGDKTRNDIMKLIGI